MVAERFDTGQRKFVYMLDELVEILSNFLHKRIVFQNGAPSKFGHPDATDGAETLAEDAGHTEVNSLIGSTFPQEIPDDLHQVLSERSDTLSHHVFEKCSGTGHLLLGNEIGVVLSIGEAVYKVLDPPKQPFFRRGVLRNLSHSGVFFSGPDKRVFPGLPIEFYFTVKVVVHCGNIGLSLATDFLDRGVVKPLFGKDYGGTFEKAVPGCLAVFDVAPHRQLHFLLHR